MPTERFYKLPKVKRDVIREAAIEEFNRVPFEKASINKIVKTAEISRGSFYTYFEDKRDLLAYIFEEADERLLQTWLQCAKECGGNLWKTAELFLEENMVQTERRFFKIVKNIIVLEDSQNMVTGMLYCKQKEMKDSRLDVIIASADLTGFRSNAREEFKLLLFMIGASIAESIGRYCWQPEEKENIIKDFRKTLNILQHGIYKN
jgi:AcrR family transcriptional regulator